MPEVSASPSSSAPAIESPPPAAQPVNPTRDDDDARGRLHRLAMQLLHTQNRRLLVEFLTLRRALR